MRNIAFEHMRAHEGDFSPFCAALMEEHVAEDMRRAGDMRHPSDVFSDTELFRMYVFVCIHMYVCMCVHVRNRQNRSGISCLYLFPPARSVTLHRAAGLVYAGPAHWMPSRGRYIDMYSRNGVWGGDPEISAMCRVYTRTAHIFVYDRVRGHRVDIRDVVPGAPPMLLSYYGGGHYDSITDRFSQGRRLQMEPGLLEQESVRQYSPRLHRFYHPQQAENGDVAVAAAAGAAGGGGAARENYVASDDLDKSRRNNTTLGKKGRGHLKQAIAKLFGTNDLAVVDDEQLLKEMEDHNVQAMLNVTGNNDPDDVDKPGGVDAHVVSKDFVEMQQAIMRQVAEDNAGNAGNPAGGGGPAHNAADAADAIAAVAAIEAAEEQVGAGNNFHERGGPAPEMTEEEQIAFALALSASENPVLAAVDVAADDESSRPRGGNGDNGGDAGLSRNNSSSADADADAQAQWAIMQSAQERRVTRSQTSHGNSGLLQQADGLSEEELMSIALALSEQDGSAVAAAQSSPIGDDSLLEEPQRHHESSRPPPGLSLAQGPEPSLHQQQQE